MGDDGRGVSDDFKKAAPAREALPPDARLAFDRQQERTKTLRDEMLAKNERLREKRVEAEHIRLIRRESPFMAPRQPGASAPAPMTQARVEVLQTMAEHRVKEQEKTALKEFDENARKVEEKFIARELGLKREKDRER